MRKTFSIVIPAYNEEENLAAAIQSVLLAVQGFAEDFEIIVVDDGSKDATAKIAAEIALNETKVVVLSNAENKGQGYSLLRGIAAAKMDYVSVFPGDNDMAWESLRDVLGAAGRADVVVSYMADMVNRSFLRQCLSRTFVLLLNTLFGLRLRYYNGPFVFKREDIQSLQIRSSGLGLIAECIVKMLKQKKLSYVEVAFVHIGRKGGKSTALSPRSAVSVAKTVCLLVLDVYFPRKIADGKE